jgi:hypothetical protein
VTGGRQSCQGRACSSWDETRKRTASPAGGPTSCIPIGRPASFLQRGSESAGCPVTLKTGVKGENLKRSSTISAAWKLSGVPIRKGGLASVGVSSRSYSSHDERRRREERCSAEIARR